MKFFITTAIDYVNSLPHIGTAYEKIGADILARFHLMLGDDVLFQMGNDEHSANVQKAAKEKGTPPKKYCDDMRGEFEEVWKKLNISYDQFIQTSDGKHHKVVYEFFDRVNKAGDIYEKDYEGWYCESCEAFYTEKDLEDGLCKNHKTKPKWLKEKNYFFKLEKYAKPLLKHIKDHPEFILPLKRRNEVVNFIEQGLQDFSISRSTFTWGIPVPLNPKHVFYVWFDALINYLSLLNLKSLDDLKTNEYWKNVTHIVGKDITRFHCVIWPAMLMSAGLPLPKTIFGHGFVYLKGEKMSKSLGNIVTPLDILNKYPDFGADALRYYLMRNNSFGDDGDFTWDGFIERYNADLANGIGNLASRILGMVWKYQKGKIYATKGKYKLPIDVENPQIVFDFLKEQLTPSKNINTHLALESIWSYITHVDQLIDKSAPWILAKENKSEELSNLLTTLVKNIRDICILVSSFIPSSAEKIWKAYGFKDRYSRETLEIFNFGLEHQLVSEKLNIFPRIDMTENIKPSSPPQEEGSNLIDIKDFGKVDLRVAKVLEAEKVEGADKLLKLQVELGAEKRQIVSGIAQHFKPEELVGKRVIVVVNLKPAKIRGIESFGMLLAAKEGDKLALVSTDGEIGSNAKVG